MGCSIRISSCGAVTPALIVPRSSTMSTRVPPVPTSIPIHMALFLHRPGQVSGAIEPRFISENGFFHARIGGTESEGAAAHLFDHRRCEHIPSREYAAAQQIQGKI